MVYMYSVGLAPEPLDFCIEGKGKPIKDSKEFTIWEAFVMYFDSLNENIKVEIEKIAGDTDEALSDIWSILLEHNEIDIRIRENILKTVVKHKLSKDNENSWFLLVNNSIVTGDMLEALGGDGERHSLLDKVKDVLVKIER